MSKPSRKGRAGAAQLDHGRPARPGNRLPAPRRRPPPAGRGGRDERRPEIASSRRALDSHHLGHAVTAGMTPPEMARDVGVPPPDLLGRQPRQQIHLILDGTAAEERAHALGTGRRLARGEFVEEAQHGPAVGAATDMLLCLPTLACRQRRIPGPTLNRAEQDRHALLVIHDHIPMTTGRPRLWRWATGRCLISHLRRRRAAPCGCASAGSPRRPGSGSAAARSPSRAGSRRTSAGRCPASPRTAPRSRDAPGRRSSPPAWGDPPAAPPGAPPRDPRRGMRGTLVGSADGRSRGRGRAPCGRRGSGPRTRGGRRPSARSASPSRRASRARPQPRERVQMNAAAGPRGLLVLAVLTLAIPLGASGATWPREDVTPAITLTTTTVVLPSTTLTLPFTTTSVTLPVTTLTLPLTTTSVTLPATTLTLPLTTTSVTLPVTTLTLPPTTTRAPPPTTTLTPPLTTPTTRSPPTTPPPP